MTYEDALADRVRKPIFKIEWMDKNENVINEVTEDIIDGKLSIEVKNGIRRTCNLTLRNNHKKYIPGEDGLVWISNRFKLYTGLIVDGVPKYNPQGIFVLGNPSVNSNFSEKTITIQAMDKFALLNGDLAGTLEAPYITNVGTRISSAVKSVITDAGMPETKVLCYPTMQLSPYTLTVDAGKSYADMLSTLADMINYQIYFDVNGNLVFEPQTDENTKGEIWTFDSKDITYLGSTHNYDFQKMKNYCVVYGDNLNSEQVKGVAEDTNIFSPTNTSKIGKKTMVINDDVIYTVSLAMQRAEYELKNAIQVYESVDIKCIPIDIIKDGDIIIIEDDSNGLNRDRYLVKNIDLPLNNNGEETMTVWKTRDIVTVANYSVDYYISTTGSDSNNGLTAQTPCRTWAHVKTLISSILDNDINVYFTPGDYHTYEPEISIDNYYGTGSITLIGDPDNRDSYIVGNVIVNSCTCLVKVSGIKIVMEGGA